jgi:hypothetical protein
MTDIYDQHKISFGAVEAFVVTHNGERVATIAFKFPRLGEGRLYAYVHWVGVSMVRGFANGYGYDKRSAACSSAAQKLKPLFVEKPIDNPAHAFLEALARDDGNTWHNQLLAAGFQVLQAV